MDKVLFLGRSWMRGPMAQDLHLLNLSMTTQVSGSTLANLGPERS